MRILIVEDEARLAATLRKGLRAEGFVVVDVASGVDGLWQATENEFDVIVLDIMLPGLSGYEVPRQLRAREVSTPVLMLTAKDGEYDQTDAFDLGADDYLTKPFSFIVLVARLRALVRRGAPQRPVVLTAGSLSLDPARRVVERDSTTISLTPREYGVLEYLMRRKDTVVTKSEMLQNVWDAHYAGPDNVVEVYVGYVRRKIDSPFGTNTVETVRGVGYRLDSGDYPTERLTATEPSRSRHRHPALTAGTATWVSSTGAASSSRAPSGPCPDRPPTAVNGWY
jgi:two-component system, OmpR family, response regulator